MTAVRTRFGRSPRRARWAANVASALCALVLALAGCRRSHAPEPAPPPPSSMPRGPAAVPAQTTASAAQPQPSVAAPWPNAPQQAAPQAAPAQPTAQAAAEEQKPRDLADELAHMLGDVSGCLQPRAAADAQSIDIAVSAHVMPGGSVSRGEASAGPLSREELACVRARVESLRFAAPIENAPLEVRASVRARPKLGAAAAKDERKTDSMGMVVTQAPSGEGVTPGVVPPADPGVVPPADPGVVPPADPPAEVMPIPEPIPVENP